MNERIRLLAEQARKYAFEKVENSQDPTEWSTKYYNEMFGEKFAELIVRECCGVLTENVEVALDASGSPVYPEGLLCEHFGVGE